LPGDGSNTSTVSKKSRPFGLTSGMLTGNLRAKERVWHLDGLDAERGGTIPNSTGRQGRSSVRRRSSHASNLLFSFFLPPAVNHGRRLQFITQEVCP